MLLRSLFRSWHRCSSPLTYPTPSLRPLLLQTPLSPPSSYRIHFSRHETDPFSHKRARVSAHAEKSRSSYRPYGGGGAPRSASPTPSYASSSTFSAATTTATALSSRASLSSCRSSSYSSYSSGGGGRYSRAGHRGKGLPSFPSSRSSYTSSCRQASSAASGDGGGGGGADFFPKPPSSWSRSRINGGVGGGGVNRWRLGSPGAERVRDGGSRDHRYVGSSRISRDRHYGCPSPSRRSCGRGNKDYASEASSSAGRKRNRSSSRERGSGCCSSRKFAAETRSGVECSRCLEWCRYSHPQRKPITRTLEVRRVLRRVNQAYMYVCESEEEGNRAENQRSQRFLRSFYTARETTTVVTT